MENTTFIISLVLFSIGGLLSLLLIQVLFNLFKQLFIYIVFTIKEETLYKNDRIATFLQKRTDRKK
jgi:hypothetical protein